MLKMIFKSRIIIDYVIFSNLKILLGGICMPVLNLEMEHSRLHEGPSTPPLAHQTHGTGAQRLAQCFIMAHEDEGELA